MKLKIFTLTLVCVFYLMGCINLAKNHLESYRNNKDIADAKKVEEALKRAYQIREDKETYDLLSLIRAKGYEILLQFPIQQ